MFGSNYTFQIVPVGDGYLFYGWAAGERAAITAAGNAARDCERLSRSPCVVVMADGRFSGLARSYLAYGAYRADVILRETVVVGLVAGTGLGSQLRDAGEHRPQARAAPRCDGGYAIPARRRARAPAPRPARPSPRPSLTPLPPHPP